MKVYKSELKSKWIEQKKNKRKIVRIKRASNECEQARAREIVKN